MRSQKWYSDIDAYHRFCHAEMSDTFLFFCEDFKMTEGCNNCIMDQIFDYVEAMKLEAFTLGSGYYCFLGMERRV